MDRGSKALNLSVGNATTYVTPQMGRVLITPLPSTSSTKAIIGSVVSKIMLKAVVSKPTLSTKRKDPKTFTLRDVNIASIDTCDKLKEIIKSQLKKDIVKDFDVGFYNGSTVVSIRSEQDLQEIWQDVKRGTQIVLWCDGLKESEKNAPKKRKHVSSDESDSDHVVKKSSKRSAAKEREGKLEEAITYLQDKHGQAYTQMQYRIWAEMYVGEYHKSLVDPPSTSMFCRAGGDTKKKKDTSTATNAPPHATSPGKVIENRSKCYKQLIDLKSLKSAGVLSESEYQTEKEAIMTSLKKFHA